MQDLTDIFGAGGPLARSLPGYAPRAEQLAMARRVAAALDTLDPLVIEAGTGTGKTFAYLVPALLSGRHTIISTGTRTLQDQLFHRDLPAVAAALGRPLKVALLKGRANYLCRHRLKLARSTPELALAAGARERTLERVELWAMRTSSGDISELAGIAESDPVWPSVTSTRDNCLGADCPEFGPCHLFAARRAAQAADVVVVNHHLLLADLALKEEGFGDLLPGTEAVILDEAHQIPELAAQFFALSLGSRQLLSLVRDCSAELQSAHLGDSGVARDLAAVESLAGEFRRQLPTAQNRVEWRALENAAIEVLGEVEKRLRRVSEELREMNAGAGLEQCARRALELAARCGELERGDDERGVRWVDVRQQTWTLSFTPFEVAERLQQLMTATPCAWIFTSATLAVGEDFSHFNTRIGMPEVRSVRIESPFDYRRQALLYMPEGISDPAHPEHARHVVSAALPLLRAAGGRTFLLFTSHRALTEGSEWLKKQPDAAAFPVFTQGEAPREVLLRQFRELGNAVLLGTSSFWEGVDVKGEALSVVVIDKLPFASPDDPVLAARLEGIRRRGGNPFYEYQLPQAVLALKQGVGRLIRDEGDYGVVMLCDPRLAAKSYGRVFLDALPPMPVTTHEPVAVQFLHAHLGTMAAASAVAAGKGA